MKVGVVGIGNMGRHHARIYNELGVLHCLCDMNERLVDAMGEKYNVEWATSVDEMLEECKPDAVSIAVPTPFHKDVAIKCLEAGCDVLLEKPMSDNLEDAAEIITVARKEQRILACGYIERYNPAFLALQDQVIKGHYGEVTSVNIKRVGGIPRSADNVVLDLMTHDFNLLTALFLKQPDDITVHKGGRNRIIDSAQALLKFGEATATCEANWVSPVKIRSISLTGTGGHCEVDMIKQTVTEYTEKTIISNQYNSEPLKTELLDFLAAYDTRCEDEIVIASDAYNTLKITLKAAG